MRLIRNDKMREAIISAFGGKCQQCGYADSRALQLDHVNGDGHLLFDRERRCRPNWDLQARYNFVMDHPDKAQKTLQLLCANCNWIKRVEKQEYRRPSREREE